VLQKLNATYVAQAEMGNPACTLAGKDWLAEFFAIYRDLSICIPQSTNLSCAVAFYTPKVKQVFDVYSGGSKGGPEGPGPPLFGR